MSEIKFASQRLVETVPAPGPTGISIGIERAEGLTEECDGPNYFDSFAQANAWLGKQSITAPKGGCYDKCDFGFRLAAFPNEPYDGRYDPKHWTEEIPDLRGHVVQFIEWTLGPKAAKLRGTRDLDPIDVEATKAFLAAVKAAP